MKWGADLSSLRFQGSAGARPGLVLRVGSACAINVVPAGRAAGVWEGSEGVWWAVGPGVWGSSALNVRCFLPSQDLVNIEMFLTAKEVEESLERRETATCLAWCHDNKSRLRKMKVHAGSWRGGASGRGGLRLCHLHLLVQSSLVLVIAGVAGFGVGFGYFGWCTPF